MFHHFKDLLPLWFDSQYYLY